jgi:hypothetical protein
MAPVKHGAYVNGKPTKLYRVWLTMRSRCNNPKVDYYHRYGGRGIKVCDRWNDFSNFKEDMGESPGPEYSLDRFPNKDGDYEPGNVRWATNEQQANNTDNVRLLTLPDGRKMSVAMAARAVGFNRLTLQNRLNRDWPEERLFDMPNKAVGQFKKGENRNRYAKKERE